MNPEENETWIVIYVLLFCFALFLGQLVGLWIRG